MTFDNAFAPPETDEPIVPVRTGPLAGMPWPELKTLYTRSCNVSSLEALLLVWSIVLVVIVVGMAGSRSVHANAWWPLVFGLLILQVVSMIGFIWRTSWGRTIGMINCVLMVLLGIGTALAGGILLIVFGGVGIAACAGGGRLFGPQRIRHADLRHAYKQAKRARRSERRSR